MILIVKFPYCNNLSQVINMAGDKPVMKHDTGKQYRYKKIVQVKISNFSQPS